MRTEAIYNIYPEVVTQDDATGCFDQNGNAVAIDEAKVAQEVKRLEAEYDSKQYQRDRADAFPSWQDQMDMLYHKGVAGWKAEIKKVKDKYPKPSE